jgi:regulator of sirC expression with transglutaminase-like and TPR domain
MAQDFPSVAAEEFRRFGDARPVDLFEGALLVSRLIDPAADLEGARARVGKLAARVTDRRAAGAPALDALREVLFAEEGFGGDTESYDEPRNSSVAHVLAARRGLPITLSIVVREVGRRAGIALEGVGLPGHFVLSGADLPEGQFLDPFHGGILCDTDSLGQRVAEIFGTPVELSSETLAPDAEPAVLRRMLANLRRSYERRHRYQEALAVLDCAAALEPGAPSGLRERGMLLLKAGRPAEALRALDEYVQSKPGEDAAAVARLIGIVRAQGGGPGGGPAAEKKVFSLGEARRLLPQIRERTGDAVSRYARLGEGGQGAEQEREAILSGWAREMAALGVEIKGPWLVDFDSGAGYYCWKYPEQALDHFHGYDEGFSGRLPLQ